MTPLFPLVSLASITPAEANELCLKWDHKLGSCDRPFRMEGFALLLKDEPIAVAISSSIVHGPVDGYRTQEVVELARLCSPNSWANRIMLRLWREVCAPTYKCWVPKAAVSYSHNGLHSGQIYRLDGWRKVRSDCGTTGSGGNWGRRKQGYKNEALHGLKTLWIWDYDESVRVAKKAAA